MSFRHIPNKNFHFFGRSVISYWSLQMFWVIVVVVFVAGKGNAPIIRLFVKCRCFTQVPEDVFFPSKEPTKNKGHMYKTL